MAYIVVYPFKDLKDNKHFYKVNDEYPREEIDIEKVSKSRIKELTTNKNKIGEILIKEIIKEDDEKENSEESTEDSTEE